MHPAGIAAGRIEREAYDRPAGALDIGNDCNDRRRHFGEIEARIPEVRLERDRGLADIDDAHGDYLPQKLASLQQSTNNSI
jgi:hypothetical protein